VEILKELLAAWFSNTILVGTVIPNNIQYCKITTRQVYYKNGLQSSYSDKKCMELEGDNIQNESSNSCNTCKGVSSLEVGEFQASGRAE
jgi:hypothetical protein